MLYTGNVNRFIFWILIPLLLISYLAFRIIEWRYYDDGGRLKIAQQHSINLSNLNDINCLILGGSNATFSLSAEQMSKEDGLNCYNLSLLNEGYSDEAYFTYISNLPIDRKQISYIFYSSIFPLADYKHLLKRLKNNEDKIGIRGDASFKLFGVSLASRLKNLLEGKSFTASYIQYPYPTMKGDFNFELYDRCDPQSIESQWSLTIKEIQLKKWIYKNISSIKNLFKKAEVYFVLPSMLQDNLNDHDFFSLSNFLQEEVTKQSVIYIEQSPFPTRDILCDGVHHANEAGREIRTSDLLKLISSFKN